MAWVLQMKQKCSFSMLWSFRGGSEDPLSAATFTGHQYLTWSLSSPLQELKADGAATPGKSGFFKRLQLPRKLRAFKVSSPHLAAYMGTGGC